MLRYLNTNIVFKEIPKEVTLAIDITNCPNRCKNCHSPWLQQDIGIQLNEDEIKKLIVKYYGGFTCICFMGGDADPKLINQLAKFIKESYSSIKVAWYSGCDRFSKDIDLKNFDYYKYGHYDEFYGPLTSNTTNQRMLKINYDGSYIDITSLFWELK